MRDKIIVVAWGDDDILQLLQISLDGWGYDLLLPNISIEQLDNIERFCLEQKPKVLIMSVFNNGEVNLWDRETNLCARLNETDENKRIGVICLHKVDNREGYWVKQTTSNFADAYFTMPLLLDELKEKIVRLIENY